MRQIYVECELRNADYHKQSFETVIVHVRSDRGVPLAIHVSKKDVVIRDNLAYIPCEIRSEDIAGARATVFLGEIRVSWMVSQDSILRS